MSIKLEMYQSDPILAIQVTAENQAEVAEWCGGLLLGTEKPGKASRARLQVPTGNPTAKRTMVARIGYWVVQEATGYFRVFYPNSFEKIFHEVVAAPVEYESKTIPDGEAIFINEQPAIVVNEPVSTEA